MKIICVGHIKTGTKSLAKALETLGYKVYDFDSQLLHHGEFWFDVLVNGVWPDVRSLYENSEEEIDVLIDLPSTFFFEEILECFPDVKVIHTVRDEDAWVRSAVNQISAMKARRGSCKSMFMQLFSSTKRQFEATLESYLNAFAGTFEPNAKAVLRKRYRLHNSHVKAVVPKEKLLVFDVKQGWEPLCEFLSCDVPEGPFPHENKQAELSKPEIHLKRPATAAIFKMIREEVRESLKVVLAVTTALVIVLFAFVVCLKM